jgi:murein DD-endopeptidase MepM/ murein hydrolase activator NlpD
LTNSNAVDRKKIPNTQWLFVTTADGYEFYYDRETKTSVWDMPDVLKEPMEELRKMEQEEKENKKRAALEEQEAEQEAKRVKLEQQEAELEEKRVKLEQQVVESHAENQQEEHAAEDQLEATE